MRERLRRFSQFTASSGVSGAGRDDDCDDRRGVDNRARFYFDEGERLAVVADHINFAFDSWRREIARNENVAVAAQVPVGVSFTADARLARAMFGGIASGIVGVIVTDGVAPRPLRAAKSIYCEHETG